MTDWFISPLCAEETCQHHDLRPEVNCREGSPTYSFLKRDVSEYLPFVVEMRGPIKMGRRDDESVIEGGEADLYLHTCSTGHDWNAFHI